MRFAVASIDDRLIMSTRTSEGPILVEMSELDGVRRLTLHESPPSIRLSSPVFDALKDVGREAGFEELRIFVDPRMSAFYARSGLSFPYDVEANRGSSVYAHRLWQSGRFHLARAIHEGKLDWSLWHACESVFEDAVREDTPIRPDEVLSIGKSITWREGGASVWPGRVILGDAPWAGFVALR